MILVGIVLRVLLVVSVMIAVAAFLLVGPERLRALAYDIRETLQAVREEAAVLLVILFFSAVAREGLQDVSELYGFRITGYIFDFEQEFVAWVQSFATPPLTTFFSYTYVYGYVFLLVFPIVAYAALDSKRDLRRLLAAYSINYAAGLICYTIFIAHGPRNLMPDMVTSLLYSTFPDFQVLTSEVNENTNVFPSLHTSLSATVAWFAYSTREAYPSWLPIASFLAVSVMIATMYLGIHWGTDVVAGLVLAALSVWATLRYVE